MASVDFEKYKTSQKVKSIFKHCDKEKRLQATHSNKDINLEMTKFNFQIESYEETCKRFDERMEWLEKQPNKNKRSDKVVCLGLEIPAPLNLSKEDYLAWSNAVFDIVSEMYGEDNVMNAYGHQDEIHDYVDCRTKQVTTSRFHLHLQVVPEIDGRLNARTACNRAHMIKLNNAIHDMSLEKFGVEFMDGSKMKDKNRIKDLKRRSELMSDIKDLEDIKKGLQDEINDIMTSYRPKQPKKVANQISNYVLDVKNRLEQNIEHSKPEEVIQRARLTELYSLMLPEDYVEAEERSDEEYT